MDGFQVNLLVAWSNIYGIPVLAMTIIEPSMPLWTVFMMAFMVSASTLMHLSEVKHGLPGIYPFNMYSTLFLWGDRISAFVCASVISYIIITNQNWGLLMFASSGLLLGGLSELASDKILFMCLHIVWHFVAYISLMLAFRIEFLH